LGTASWHDGIPRCPSEPVFRGPSNNLRPGLCAAGDRIYAAGVATAWAIRAPAEPAASLRGLFFRRSRRRHLRNREGSTGARRVAGAALGYVARDCIGGVLALDHTNGTDFQAPGCGPARPADQLGSRLRAVLCQQLIFP